MITEKETYNAPRMLKIIKHTLAAFIAGYSLFVIVLVWIANPGYVSILILPDSESQPMGWFMTFAILFSILSTYAIVIILCNILFSLFQPQAIKWKAMKVIGMILLVVCIYTLRTVAILIALIGPAILKLMESSVGRMFFGS
jgi:hypothetical protein